MFCTLVLVFAAAAFGAQQQEGVRFQLYTQKSISALRRAIPLNINSSADAGEPDVYSVAVNIGTPPQEV